MNHFVALVFPRFVAFRRWRNRAQQRSTSERGSPVSFNKAGTDLPDSPALISASNTSASGDIFGVLAFAGADSRLSFSAKR
jgi:hypothetical protein